MRPRQIMLVAIFPPLIFSATARASFELVPSRALPPPASVQAQDIPSPRIGTTEHDIPPSHIIVRDMALGEAARRLVPQSFRVTFKPARLAAQPVSFTAIGRPWRVVLEDSLASKALYVDVNEQEVLISDSPQPVAPPPSAASDSAPGGPVELLPEGPPARPNDARLAGWVLRGARPGKAWVVAPAGEQTGPLAIEEKHSYPGLGMVSRIYKQDDHWIIEAEHGWFEGATR